MSELSRIPIMLDGSVVEAEYDYTTPENQITGIYIGGVRVLQDDIIDAVLTARGVDELEQEIRDTEFSDRADEEFLRDNRWPDRPGRTWQWINF